MLIFESIFPLQKKLLQTKIQQQTVGFVPTMGALHEGHLHLVKKAKEENDIVVASIYVNPTQFNNATDLEKYPRTLEKDIELLESVDCDILFAPSNQEMYPQPSRLQFDFGTLEMVMEGKFRKGHFNGVATVVSKFFNIVQPDKAYFGQKDLQQYLIVRQLVNDLSFPLQLVQHPIVRESDGLAMSSRNKRLTPTQRQIAPQVYKALVYAQENIFHTPLAQLKQQVANMMNEVEGMELEYFEVAHGETLESLEQVSKGEPIALCIAVFVGEIRLIDNILLSNKY